MKSHKNVIKLTENDLHNIISHSVKKILKEDFNNKTNPQELSYQLMVVLGDIQNEMQRDDGEPITIEDIDYLYGLATQLYDYFDE